ncbi:ribonuclease E/G, partial [Pseudoalteromonas sp. AC71-MNA-CIBAN-0107]
LVFMPDATHVGVSQRIETEEERGRLKKIVAEYSDENGSFIVRTAAEGASEAELRHDAAFLQKLWQKVVSRRKKTSKASILHEDLT